MIHPKLQVVTLTAANTEYSVEFADRTKKIMIKGRTNAVIRIAWETGKVATPTDPYLTIASGVVWYENDLQLNYGTKLYLASPNAGLVVEVASYD